MVSAFPEMKQESRVLSRFGDMLAMIDCKLRSQITRSFTRQYERKGRQSAYSRCNLFGEGLNENRSFADDPFHELVFLRPGRPQPGAESFIALAMIILYRSCTLKGGEGESIARLPAWLRHRA